MRVQIRGRRILALALAPVMLATLAACGTDRSGSDKIINMWTVLAGDIDMKAQRAVIAAFEKDNPGYQVRLVPKPNASGAPNGDLTNIVAAVRGGQPPDIYLVDRFAVAQQASVGLLENLQPRIDDEGGDLMDNYLAFAAQETQYESDTYALPLYTDNRGLFYNKKLMREAGVNPKVLDPKNGPPTIDKVMAIAKKMNKTDQHGNYRQIGLIPWDAQGFSATWGLQQGAKYFDNETCEIVPSEPAFMKTFNDFRKWSNQLDYDKVQAFIATYRPPEQPPEQSPFLTGKLGMAIDGNYTMTNIEDYAPDLDYGTTWLPVQKEGDKPFSWGGGFSLSMPTGATNRDGAWKFMKYMTGRKGQKIYTSNVDQIPTWKTLAQNENYTKHLGVFADVLPYTVSRPPLPVGSAFDGAMTTAQEAVLSGESTPKEALDNVYDRVGEQMKQFCPFKLPPKAVGVS